MALLDIFKFKTDYSLNSELPEIYPLSIQCDFFVTNDLINIYNKILTDCIERTQGINETIAPLFWDNCLQSESTKGLVSLLADAMAYKKDLYIVYDKSINFLRKATSDEQAQIRSDYQKVGESKIGIYVSFAAYTKTDMLKIYSSMEYCVLDSLNKSMNLSKAVQLKMDKLREGVGATDSQQVIDQAKSIANALSEGKDVLIDAKDSLSTATIDMQSTKEAISFLDAKRCFYLDLPLSYITGEQTGGIGSTGEADTRAVERGLKHYWVSIIEPVVNVLFGVKIEFKSHDFRQISSALEAIKTFELVSNDMLSMENKQLIIAKLFDVDTDQSLPKEQSVNDNQISSKTAFEKNSSAQKD
jgi:hypothetical protein